MVDLGRGGEQVGRFRVQADVGLLQQALEHGLRLGRLRPQREVHGERHQELPPRPRLGEALGQELRIAQEVPDTPRPEVRLHDAVAEPHGVGQRLHDAEARAGPGRELHVRSAHVLDALVVGEALAVREVDLQRVLPEADARQSAERGDRPPAVARDEGDVAGQLAGDELLGPRLEQPRPERDAPRVPGVHPLELAGLVQLARDLHVERRLDDLGALHDAPDAIGRLVLAVCAVDDVVARHLLGQRLQTQHGGIQIRQGVVRPRGHDQREVQPAGFVDRHADGGVARRVVLHRLLETVRQDDDLSLAAELEPDLVRLGRRHPALGDAPEALARQLVEVDVALRRPQADRDGDRTTLRQQPRELDEDRRLADPDAADEHVRAAARVLEVHLQHGAEVVATDDLLEISCRLDELMRLLLSHAPVPVAHALDLPEHQEGPREAERDQGDEQPRDDAARERRVAAAVPLDPGQVLVEESQRREQDERDQDDSHRTAAQQQDPRPPPVAPGPRRHRQRFRLRAPREPPASPRRHAVKAVRVPRRIVREPGRATTSCAMPLLAGRRCRLGGFADPSPRDGRLSTVAHCSGRLSHHRSSRDSLPRRPARDAARAR